MSNIIYGRTQPTIITNDRGMATQGYTIEISFPEFEEIHDLRVASLDPKVVKAAGEKLDDADSAFLEEFLISNEYRMIGKTLEDRLKKEAANEG